MGKKSRRKQPKITEEVADSDDEEISEDGAFDSDDERKYGMFFSNTGDDSDEECGSDDDDDDDGDNSDSSASDNDEDDGGDGDDDGGQYMLDLLDQIDSKKPPPQQRNQDESNPHVLHVKESPSAVSTTSQHLTLDALMDGIQDTQGFGSLQQSMKKLAKPTAAPVARVVSDRAHRKVQYENQREDIAQWTHAVQENRQA